MKIQLSETEFQDLSQRAQVQGQNIADLVKHLDGVVQGSDWRSRAAESFRLLWKDHMTLLREFEASFQDWNQNLKVHAETAGIINTPYR